MSRARIEKVRSEVQRAQALLAEVLQELDGLASEQRPQRAQGVGKKGEPPPTAEQSQADFDRLYQQYLSGDTQSVEGFVAERSKQYFKVFCQANNLQLDPKRASKDKIVSEVLRRFAQRKAITGASFSA